MTTTFPLARQIDGIPVVASTADRTAKYPTPSTNQRVQNLATGAIERYTGTAWVTDFIATGGSGPTTAQQVAVNAYFDGITWRATAPGSAWVFWQDVAGNLQIGASAGPLSAAQAFTPVNGLELLGSGAVTAPTPNPGDNTTNVATTAYVVSAVSGLAPLASPIFVGTPTAPTPGAGDNSTRLATTAYVKTSYAPLASPALTGVPTAPTALATTSTTQLATTAFTHAAILYAHSNVLYHSGETNQVWGVPPDASVLVIRAYGGGGGGGGGGGAATAGGGGGGGNGQACIGASIPLWELGSPTSVYISVGLGGTAGAAAGAGGNGGTTLIGTAAGPTNVFLSLSGGAGGAAGTNSVGGAGGGAAGTIKTYGLTFSPTATGGAGSVSAAGAIGGNSGGNRYGGSGGGGGATVAGTQYAGGLGGGLAGQGAAGTAGGATGGAGGAGTDNTAAYSLHFVPDGPGGGGGGGGTTTGGAGGAGGPYGGGGGGGGAGGTIGGVGGAGGPGAIELIFF
jgi:hypothetical protein